MKPCLHENAYIDHERWGTVCPDCKEFFSFIPAGHLTAQSPSPRASGGALNQGTISTPDERKELGDIVHSYSAVNADDCADTIIAAGYRKLSAPVAPEFKDWVCGVCQEKVGDPYKHHCVAPVASGKWPEKEGGWDPDVPDDYGNSYKVGWNACHDAFMAVIGGNTVTLKIDSIRRGLPARPDDDEGNPFEALDEFKAISYLAEQGLRNASVEKAVKVLCAKFAQPRTVGEKEK